MILQGNFHKAHSLSLIRARKKFLLMLNQLNPLILKYILSPAFRGANYKNYITVYDSVVTLNKINK